jgi:RNA polymerase sigma-54 factor
MFVYQGQSLRHQATAHLAQAMSFLALSTVELEARLLKELDDNPALELVEELRCPGCGKRLRRRPCPNCAVPRGDNAPVVCMSPRDLIGYRRPGDEPPEARAPERLDEYIFRQVGPFLGNGDRPIAAYILARLDEEGLLPEPAATIAAYLNVSVCDVERVLTLIQHADPPGMGAQTLEESLLIQLESLADAAPSSVIRLGRVIIQDHLECLAKREYAHIARDLGVPRTDVETVAQFIQRNLTPYPARSFWGEGMSITNDGSTLGHPDVSISLFNGTRDGPLLVEVFAPLAGWLRVNPEFKAAVAECAGADRTRWSEAVERAALVTHYVQQRSQTLRSLMDIIATQQRGFILGGDSDLRPLTRTQIAKALDVHESTISRAVAGKSATLPSGQIIPLSKFFDRSLSVRDRVRSLVEAEALPLTDSEIAAKLACEGVEVARRTVAKYRSMLGILPANLRAGALKTQLGPASPTNQRSFKVPG